jgi:hypothetical protein
VFVGGGMAVIISLRIIFGTSVYSEDLDLAILVQTVSQVLSNEFSLEREISFLFHSLPSSRPFIIFVF